MSDLAKNVSFLDLVYKMFQNPVLGPAGETYDPLSTFLCQRGGEKDAVGKTKGDKGSKKGRRTPQNNP